jgi:LysR family hydrogen peroxide-inducible transcriptional activator
MIWKAVEHPKLLYIIGDQITETIIQRIKSGHLDVGIFATPVNTRGLHFDTLFYEKFFLYLSEKHELYTEDQIPLEEIDLEEIWYLQEGNCFPSQVHSICKRSGKAPPSGGLKYISNSIESLRRIVEQKKGLTFIPELATIEVPLEYEEMIKPIRDMDPVREISLVSRSNPTKKKTLDTLKKVILAHIPARMKTTPSNWIVDTKIDVL